MKLKVARSLHSVPVIAAVGSGIFPTGAGTEPSGCSLAAGGTSGTITSRCAWLPSDDLLAARALRDADLRPAGLWARRSRVALRGAPLLMQEVFLPAIGQPAVGRPATGRV